MQGYGQAPEHQRQGSVASFAGQEPTAPPLPPRTYAGYQSPVPNAHSQWAPAPPPASHSWAPTQQQHAAGAYNPGTYGVIGQATSATQPSYPPRREDQPPPPPPKPHGFAAAVHQQQQYQQQQGQYQQLQPQPQSQHEWPQQAQQTPAFTPQAQDGSYAAPPPHSAPPGGSYFPPAHGGRPGSMYGASQIGAHATPPPAASQHTYTAPPINTPGAHTFVPSSSNTTPGAYASPPSAGAPAWQHAHQVPSQQGNANIAYTQPTANTGFQTQGHQDALSRHAQQILQPQASYGINPPKPYGHQAQNQYVPQALPQPSPLQHSQYGHHTQPQQHSYGQPLQPPDQPQQGNTIQHAYNSGYQAEWQASPQFEQSDLPPRNEPWQSDHQSQGPPPVQQHNASKPGASVSNVAGRTDGTSSQYFRHPSPQSQPVSPIGPQQSIGSGLQFGHGRPEAVQSNISSDNEAHQPTHDTTSLAPLAPRADNSRFSALGVGGPSDWERLSGDGDEIDDEEAFSRKKVQETTVMVPPDSVELPAHVPSPPSTHGWPSPAQSNPSYSHERKSTYAPTPPPGKEPSLYVSTTPSLSKISGTAAPNSEWAASQQTPTQGPAGWSSQTNDQHNAELMERDEAFERLRIDAEKERAGLDAEIEKLKVDIETVRSNAANEMTEVRAELDTLKATSEQVAAEFAAVKREKDITIERMKEDAEGKEHNIDERDVIIADLKRQVEVEKSKEVPKPTPTDLIPDIDPWYIGSLERYIAMLQREANEPQVEEKIKTFRAFCKAESEIRGIDYYDAPPPASLSSVAHLQQHPKQTVGPSDSPVRPQDLNIQVPQQPLPEEDNDDNDYNFSPGGRPILKHPPTLTVAERASTQSQTNASSQSTMILTPTSSVEGNTNKTPVQSPPEEISQPQYKAYVPAASVPEFVPLTHKAATSFSSISGLPSPSGHSKGPDEIFFGAHNQPQPTSNSRPTESNSPVAIPAPLKFASNRPVSIAAPSRQTPSETLVNLLPDAIVPSATSHSMDEARARFVTVKSKTNNNEESTKAWEKSASLNRRKRDDARHKREEQNEEHNNELFDNEEISYAEMNQREEDFKEEEGELKAQEDRDEYKSYVEAVFDPIYDALQTDIKTLGDLRVDVESVLPTSVSGVQQLQNGDAPSTRDCLGLLQSIHELVENRHAAIVETLAERDKRFKKTELQPLYAAGNIIRMKDLERKFEQAERQAVLKAKREKAERVAEFVRLTEEVVIDAVSIEQGEIDRIVTAIKEFEDAQGDADLLTRAHDTLMSLKKSSKALLSLFNSLEISLNDSVLDEQIAQVKVEGGAARRLQELEDEKMAGAKKMTVEYERRIAVLEQDDFEIEQLVRRKGGKMSEQRGDGKQERLKAALEEAKRRNGEI